MMKSFLQGTIVLGMLAFYSVQTLTYPTYPEKILIKNATGEPITYSIRFRTNRMQAQIAFVWLEAGEELNITEKHYLHKPLKYLHIAINLKDPSKMWPFSTTDSKAVDLGNYKEIRITVYKRIYGPSHYAFRPVVRQLPPTRHKHRSDDCYNVKND